MLLSACERHEGEEKVELRRRLKDGFHFMLYALDFGDYFMFIQTISLREQPPRGEIERCSREAGERRRSMAKFPRRKDSFYRARHDLLFLQIKLSVVPDGTTGPDQVRLSPLQVQGFPPVDMTCGLRPRFFVFNIIACSERHFAAESVILSKR